ncbi:MAG: GIY-YIG nuclease family protein, partial [Bacteroidetes bacterium]|nr:GIY-YIG nuclease family protein [Bacteroidota bacterium]
MQVGIYPALIFMHYVYVLHNLKSRDLYYGYTNNVERRFEEHNRKQEWKLVYYEAYSSEEDARLR